MELHYQPTWYRSTELTAFNENLELNLGWPLRRSEADCGFPERRTKPLRGGPKATPVVLPGLHIPA